MASESSDDVGVSDESTSEEQPQEQADVTKDSDVDAVAVAVPEEKEATKEPSEEEKSSSEEKEEPAKELEKETAEVQKEEEGKESSSGGSEEAAAEEKPEDSGDKSEEASAKAEDGEEAKEASKEASEEEKPSEEEKSSEEEKEKPAEEAGEGSGEAGESSGESSAEGESGEGESGEGESGEGESGEGESGEGESGEGESSEGEEEGEEKEKDADDEGKAKGESKKSGKAKKGRKKRKKKKKGPKTNEEVEAAIKTRTQNSGALYIRVPGARDLLPKSNPFIVVTINGEKQLSLPVQKKTSSPKWEEKDSKKTLFIEDKSKTTIGIYVFSKIGLIKKPIGQIEFNIENFMLGVPVNKWYKLEPKKKGKDVPLGNVHLHVMFMDKTDKVVGTEFDYPLHTILRKHNVEAVDRLMVSMAKADNSQDEEGRTAVHIAALEGLDHSLTLLLRKKFDFSTSDNNDQSPLHLAATKSASCVQLLLEAGADAKAQDTEGNTPIHIAATRNQAKAIDVFIKHDSKLIDATNKAGDTPLMSAIKLRNPEAITALVKNGADLHKENKDTFAPIDLPGERYQRFLLDLSNAGKINIDEERITPEIITHFMNSLKLLDVREFLCMKLYRERHLVECGSVSFGWNYTNPQILVTVPETISAQVIAHFPEAKGTQNEVVGCSILELDTLATGKYKIPSHLIGAVDPTFTKESPLTYKFEAGKQYVLLPFTKFPDIAGDCKIMIYTEPDKKVSIVPLEEWKERKKTSSEWTGPTAGGAQPNETWVNNPHFSLTLPVGKSVQLCLMVSQASITSDMSPLGVEPYPHFIGFYLYDRARKTLIGQSYKTWLNSRDVWASFDIDTAEVGDKFLIIPCTNKAGVERRFKFTVLCSTKFKLKKAVSGEKA